jgi:hypothetical protein
MLKSLAYFQQKLFLYTFCSIIDFQGKYVVHWALLPCIPYTYLWLKDIIPDISIIAIINHIFCNPYISLNINSSVRFTHPHKYALLVDNDNSGKASKYRRTTIPCIPPNYILYTGIHKCNQQLCTAIGM